MIRSSLKEFELANPMYAGASVSFYTVVAGVKTATLATLYSGTTGSGTLANPQELDSDGKFAQPVYYEVAVIGVVDGYSQPDHELSIAYPAFVRYFGALAANPTTNPITNGALATGDSYYNTVSSQVRTYNGSTWLSAFDVTAAGSVSFTPTGSIVGTNVQAAIAELDLDLTAHLDDTADAHDATAISYAGSAGLSATTVEAALDELDSEKAAVNAAAAGDLAGTYPNPTLTALVFNALTLVTIASTDHVAIADASDSGNKKKALVSDITALVDKLNTATGSAPSYSARAWVHFNGTGTPAIANSGNVSSITDNGTGDYSVNFTVALPSASGYAAVGMAGTSPSYAVVKRTSSTASAFRCLCQAQSGGSPTATDMESVAIAFFE